MYRHLIRPLLFNLSAESAHNFAAAFLKLASLPVLRNILAIFYRSTDHEFELMGLKFSSRLGIAAGFDKNASMFKGLSALGFGFVEIGTITPKAQPGNPKPRLFRLSEDKALINRMGFNNDGMMIAAKRLKNRPKSAIVGGNIGKNKVTPNEVAIGDYEKCFTTLFPYVDYFVVNVSSPNTPGLRELQDKEPLLKILNRLQELNHEKEKRKPILLKIAPDLTDDQLDDIIDIVSQSSIEGVIATNTTISRDNLKTESATIESIGMGGLSGMPLRNRSLEVVKYLSDKSNKSFVIIGVGGISNEEDAKAFIDVGADLVQIYTSFIYNGPSIISRINSTLNNYEKAV